jgi:hypothetical protein
MMPTDNHTQYLEEKATKLKNILQQGACNIVFTKVDGTERTMCCTLDASRIPAAPLAENKKTKTANPQTLSVWSINDNSWRSFRIDNLIAIHLQDGGNGNTDQSSH